MARSHALDVSRALLFSLCVAGITAVAQEPGNANASVQGDHYLLSNEAVAAQWSLSGGHLTGLTMTDRRHSASLPMREPFALLLPDGAIYTPANLHADGQSGFQKLIPDPNSARTSDHFPGEEFTLPLASDDGNLRASWSVVLRDGSNYIRQILTISAVHQDASISEVRLIDASMPGAHVAGMVKGSPIVADDFFLGFEDPLSQSYVVKDRMTAEINRVLPLRQGQSVTYSSVVGVVRTGQLRRDFLNYVERERAHPYRTFLHYNSWYDLGYFTPYDEAGALDRIHAFGDELHARRGVTLDSFLFDDGWDNHQSLWSFNSGFPDGFTKVSAAAREIGAGPGLWLSPWGGYDGPQKERLQYGRQAGYEIVDNGFALSGPRYYQHFLDVCLEMIRKYGVNQFKFDGTGNADTVFRGSAFDSDFDAAMHLIGELRKAEPKIYINLTTGTYPSPFWLLYADSIWRGGEDDTETGVGTTREQWITYRDTDTYDEVVQEGPLYPLNSLMLHGIIYARYNRHLNTDPGNDFRNEVRSYFGTGTQCQEMYITPSLLTQANWDDLAEAANWSRANADVLRDTHWVGGNPGWLEVYGWAAWAPKKGILTLRNPSDHAQSIRINLRDAFELPDGAPQDYTARSPWKEDAGKPQMEIRARVPQDFRLAPFEVLTLEFTPR